jgi:nucleotide-binding universal stress UspA family protein
MEARRLAMNANPILIAYDGSEDADYALDEAAEMCAGRRAVVLYVRQLLESVAAHLEGHPALERLSDADAFERDAAERIAAQGAERARAAGIDAEPEVASSIESVGDTIVHVSEQLDAPLVVLGSRGLRGLRSILLGSVSHHVVHHAHRPVLVIPSPRLASARRDLPIVAEPSARTQQPATPA